MATDFEQWTERVRAHGDYVAKLGQYKLDVAKAELESARAAHETERTKATVEVIKQLKRDLHELNGAKMKTKEEIERLSKRGRQAGYLIRGRKILDYQASWRALDRFLSDAMLDSDVPLFDILISPEAKASSNFLDNADSRAACEEAPEWVGNVLQLCSWLRGKQYVPKLGSKAQYHLMEVFEAINKVAEAEVATLNARIQQIRDGTYDVWTLPSILGAPPAKRNE